MVRRVYLLASVVLMLTPAGAAQAQSPTPLTPEAGPLDVAVNWRSRAEVWDWFEGNTGNSDYGFGHSQLRVSIGQKRSKVDWFVEGEAITVFALPSDAVAPAPLGQLGHGATYYAANGSENNASGFLKQAYLHLKQLGQTNLKVGRFEFFDGAEARSSEPLVETIVNQRVANRLISNFAFTAVQRSFDGAQFQWNAGAHNFTAFGGRPTEGVFQVNAMKEVDVQSYYGAYNTSVKTTNGGGALRVFGVGYIDTRSTVLKVDNRPQAARAADTGDIKIGTWGANYVHVFHTKESGAFDVIGWGALQTGQWGNLTQRAGAFVAELGWQAQSTPLKPWISGGYSYGTGDKDPHDGTHGTFFQLLPTPRQYARFPFYNMMNNKDVYATFNFRPIPKLAVRSEVHDLHLADAADLWYLGGGAFQQSTFGFQGRPSNGHTDLSTVADVSADYPLTRYLNLTLYYAHATGGLVVSAIYPKSPDGQLSYVEATVHF